MISRLWVYQQERFPIVTNGLLVIGFSLSAVSYSVLLRARSLDPIQLKQIGSLWQFEQFSLPQSIAAALIAWVVIFLFCLQLRIADEFKDYTEDFRYRPYRPVPRGLVTLRDLGLLAIACAAVQLGLSLAIHPKLILPLLLVWVYIALSSQHFFVPNYLKAYPLAYLFSQALIMPLIAFYATACDWLKFGPPPQGIVVLLLVCLANGLVLEMGRKIRAPKDEERGIVTYTARWGVIKSTMAWLLAIWFMTVTTIPAASYVSFTTPILVCLTFLLALSALVVWQFLSRPTTTWASRFEFMSNVWSLLIYPCLGLIPLLLRH
jgi:4-hydroxybenzoate polyprenyltransferase